VAQTLYVPIRVPFADDPPCHSQCRQKVLNRDDNCWLSVKERHSREQMLTIVDFSPLP
jgi:hypothetical protein